MSTITRMSIPKKVCLLAILMIILLVIVLNTFSYITNSKAIIFILIIIFLLIATILMIKKYKIIIFVIPIIVGCGAKYFDTMAMPMFADVITLFFLVITSFFCINERSSYSRVVKILKHKLFGIIWVWVIVVHILGLLHISNSYYGIIVSLTVPIIVISLLIIYTRHENYMTNQLFVKAIALNSLIISIFTLILFLYPVVVDNKVLGQMYFPWGNLTRASAWWSNPNGVGVVLWPGLFALVAYSYKIVDEYRVKALISLNMIFCIMAVLLVTVALLLTGSRSSILGVAVATIIFILLYRGVVSGISTILGFSIVATPILLKVSIIERYVFRSEVGATGREYFWGLALEGWKQNVLIGHGIGSWYSITESHLGAHNAILRLLFETGVLGTSVYLLINAIFIFCMIRSWNKIRKISSSELQWSFSVIVAIYFGCLVQGIFETHFIGGIDPNNIIYTSVIVLGFLLCIFVEQERKIFDNKNKKCLLQINI
ncbi:hypothetical protein N752_30075 [Desulforamulus aquiferis]|nr:O-antigen ligase family protein [Desulforamulus aquiferis]RYD01246.1 hypothetical protein N752_30075 [Desulforamulus aquiferis]